MDVNGEVQLLRIGANPLQGCVGYGIGGVRGEGATDQRVGAELVVHLDPLVEIFVRVGRPCGGEVDDYQPDHGAHPGTAGDMAGDIREEVHVVEAGGAAAQHLGYGQLCAVTHELGAYPSPFGRPDVLVEPLHQRQVVGQAAQQGHGGMGVGIHQPGDQEMFRQVVAALRPVACLRLRGGQDLQDPAILDGDCVPLVDRVGGLHRDHPAGMDQGVDGLHHLSSGHGGEPVGGNGKLKLSHHGYSPSLGGQPLSRPNMRKPAR